MELNHLSFKFSWHVRSYGPGSNFCNVWYWSNQCVRIAGTQPHRTKTQVYSWWHIGRLFIKHLGGPNTVLVLLLFLLGTTAYSSSSSSSLYRKSDLNGWEQRKVGVFWNFWSREKAREPYHPPIYGFLVLLECLFLQAHAYDLLFCAFWLLFDCFSDGG